jgi:hypothetical protein
MAVVMGQIAHPIGKDSPYRIGNDGIPRILPGSGGISINQRIGDRCVGLAGDHIEPGVSLHNNKREIVGEKNGPNLALLTYSCVGNPALVVSGPCSGKQGTVTGKHGGIQHLIVDFPDSVLRRLRIGDKIQIFSFGLGLKFTDHPVIKVFNCSPRLFKYWGLRSIGRKLMVPVTHIIPASIMGSGIGKNNVVRGDFDIQLFNHDVRKLFKLESLRFGDFVAIVHSDSGYGGSYRRGSITVGIIVHGDSTVSGHGPGILSLLTADGRYIFPLQCQKANLAIALKLRKLPPVKAYGPIVKRNRAKSFRDMKIKSALLAKQDAYRKRNAIVKERRFL